MGHVGTGSLGPGRGAMADASTGGLVAPSASPLARLSGEWLTDMALPGEDTEIWLKVTINQILSAYPLCDFVRPDWDWRQGLTGAITQPLFPSIINSSDPLLIYPRETASVSFAMSAS